MSAGLSFSTPLFVLKRAERIKSLPQRTTPTSAFLVVLFFIAPSFPCPPLPFPSVMLLLTSLQHHNPTLHGLFHLLLHQNTSYYTLIPKMTLQDAPNKYASSMIPSNCLINWMQPLLESVQMLITLSLSTSMD
uniref:Uncharacterized protein n=1 Tax=Timspurckia oligopyrenoides TaxID=708627 RepID=A0A7S0ZEJ0_9RHOD